MGDNHVLSMSSVHDSKLLLKHYIVFINFRNISFVNVLSNKLRNKLYAIFDLKTYNSQGLFIHILEIRQKKPLGLQRKQVRFRNCKIK